MTASRSLAVAAAQLGPVDADEPRSSVVARLVTMLETAADAGCALVAFPELALTTFFPRWWTDAVDGHDRYFETRMPGPQTQPLFDAAQRCRVGFSLGYAELTDDGHRYNTTVLVDSTGAVVGRYRKVHVPGHHDHQPVRPFQHLEQRYFEESDEGFSSFRAFGVGIGLATCNDRRWPETYRELRLAGAEMVLLGYNTPLHYAPDPSQDALAGFHNHLVMQAGAYQNGLWVVGVAKGGAEHGVESLAESAIIAPSGQIVACAATDGDEVITAVCDLDMGARYRETLFDLDHYWRPSQYRRIATRLATPNRRETPT